MNIPLLAASLYNQYEYANNNNINIIFNIPSSKLFCPLPEYLLTDFVHILVQNAIEATHSGQYIYVCIQNRQNYIVVEVRNPSTTFYSKEDLHLLLTCKPGKSDKTKEKKDGIAHGYGLYHLRKTLTKYEGVLVADCVNTSDTNWIVFRMVI